MSLSPYELVLIAGCFTILGAIIGGWIGYRNALSIHKISEFNKAAAAFRDAFLPEILLLRYGVGTPEVGSSDGGLANILTVGLVNRHIKALNIFRGYLASRQRHAIDKAWEDYQAYVDGCTDMSVGAGREDTLNRIETLLDNYASLK